MDKEQKITNVSPYTTKEGKAVVGHERRVRIGKKKQERTTKRAIGSQTGLHQQVEKSEPGASFLTDTQFMFNVHKLDDGRMVGINEETYNIERAYEQAKEDFRSKKTQENLEKKRQTRSAYRTALAGNEHSYIRAELHVRQEVAYKIRPRTKIEQENCEMLKRIRKLQKEKEVKLVDEVPAYEEYMRMRLGLKIQTPEGAARFLNPSAFNQNDINETIKKLSKPSLMQKFAARKENLAMKKLLKRLES